MKTRFAMQLAFFTLIGALELAFPTVAAADGHDLRKNFPSPRANPALTQWRDGRDWSYDTGYLFGVTRGLNDQNVPRWCQGAAWIVSVPFDLANLPFAAVAGLFGD